MYVLLYLCVVLAIYAPLLQKFFWSDDWYILSLSQISHVGEFFRFFSFVPSQYTTPVYRPLSSEAFFFAMQKVFGLHPVPFHIVSFMVWGLGIWVLYKLLRILLKNETTVWLTMTFFIFSSSHFTRLAYLSAFQEVLMFTCTILALYLMVSWRGVLRRVAGLCLFISALLSKESAVVLPVLLVIVQWYRDKGRIDLKHYKPYLPFFLVLAGYMYLRFVIRGAGGVGESYDWDFSIIRAAHTTLWYGLWSIGVPEFLIDYVGSGFQLIQRFWSDFRGTGVTLVLLMSFLGGAIGTASVWFLFLKEKPWRELLLGAGWFIVGLLPILFLPTHKYALGQSVALVGICIFLSVLMSALLKRWLTIFVVLYVGFNLFSIGLYYTYHVSMQRSEISKKVYEYIHAKYPIAPAGFYFTNDGSIGNIQWGQSKQIDQAISKHFFSVMYGSQVPSVVYEDYEQLSPDQQSGWVVIKSSNFLQ